MKALGDEVEALKKQQGEDARRHSQSLAAAQAALHEVRLVSLAGLTSRSKPRGPGPSGPPPN